MSHLTLDYISRLLKTCLPVYKSCLIIIIMLEMIATREGVRQRSETRARDGPEVDVRGLVSGKVVGMTGLEVMRGG